MMSRLRGKRVGVAVSGGVDSLCAMLLLRESGCQVFALHGRFTEKEACETKALEDICGGLSVELHIADLRQIFAENLLRPFAEDWINGQTPNPCALCNREIKFGVLRRLAFQLGADFFATGHYVRAFRHQAYGRNVLGPAMDSKKDQSYFLSLVRPENLDGLIFPLASHTKEECRKIVEAAGLTPPAPGESQDICFLDNGESHADFVEKWAQKHFLPSDTPGFIYILERDASGIIRKAPAGRHKGLRHYTIGQRKGLGIPYSQALYVLAREKESGSLLLAPRSALVLKSCQAGRLNLFVPEEKWPSTLYSRLRYRQKAARVRARLMVGRLFLEFEEPQFPGAEGQVATVEDAEGVILAAGLVERMCFEN